MLFIRPYPCGWIFPSKILQVLNSTHTHAHAQTREHLHTRTHTCILCCPCNWPHAVLVISHSQTPFGSCWCQAPRRSLRSLLIWLAGRTDPQSVHGQQFCRSKEQLEGKTPGGERSQMDQGIQLPTPNCGPSTTHPTFLRSQHQSLLPKPFFKKLNICIL